MNTLYAALLEEQHNPKGSHDNHFSRRLAGIDMQHKLLAQSSKLDTMKEAIVHLNAAKGEQDDMSVVVSHVKSAISLMTTFVNENQNHFARRHRNLQKDGAVVVHAPAVTADDFSKSVECVARAAVDNEMDKFLLCADAVKQGIQLALNKLDSVLIDMKAETMEELAKRWKEAQKDPEIAAAMDDAGPIASAVTKAIELILEQPIGEMGLLPDSQDFKQLIWMVPISVVWGGVLWMFIGLWEYGPEYGIIGSLWFEITWILSGLGCLMDNPLACGTWNP
jgi:hypothetical protein